MILLPRISIIVVHEFHLEEVSKSFSICQVTILQVQYPLSTCCDPIIKFDQRKAYFACKLHVAPVVSEWTQFISISGFFPPKRSCVHIYMHACSGVFYGLFFPHCTLILACCKKKDCFNTKMNSLFGIRQSCMVWLCMLMTAKYSSTGKRVKNTRVDLIFALSLSETPPSWNTCTSHQQPVCVQYKDINLVSTDV